MTVAKLKNRFRAVPLLPPENASETQLPASNEEKPNKGKQPEVNQAAPVPAAVPSSSKLPASQPKIESSKSSSSSHTSLPPESTPVKAAISNKANDPTQIPGASPDKGKQSAVDKYVFTRLYLKCGKFEKYSNILLYFIELRFQHLQLKDQFQFQLLFHLRLSHQQQITINPDIRLLKHPNLLVYLLFYLL